MAVTVVNEAKRGLLSAALDQNVTKIGLFVFGPPAGQLGATRNDFAAPIYAGYAPITLVWGPVALSPTNKAYSTADPVVFERGPVGGANTVLGYYLSMDDIDLVAYEYFPAPRSMSSAGDKITIIPTFYLDQTP